MNHPTAGVRTATDGKEQHHEYLLVGPTRKVLGDKKHHTPWGCHTPWSCLLTSEQIGLFKPFCVTLVLSCYTKEDQSWLGMPSGHISGYLLTRVQHTLILSAL